ncbi:hypothetical protein FPQ18DRAFT_330445 [Pyronema domesticum]|uniref:Similar to Vacuolar segregation protein pep7 acc. no. O13786 n=1 Tax=Pyronema omphalodes (strain CBS 100304) TaxID=1076935 RepID=U4L999_PYROM|nr:hypothetical protein FPQ18DRAFT_330445 [Pyronema domesticum]CCX14992.1 Similar to Vacuolar segregation protein pep7; acc. no. O13786 [Pyronema omphalodes CBS 100304]
MASPRPTPLAVPPVSPRAAGEARQSSTAQSIQSKPPTTRPKRVLGSTATATNFKPRSTRDQQTHTPSSSVSVSNARLSPSASEVSFTSRSDVSRGPEGLVCPICSEEMMTLLQLNRHLDDLHAEVESFEKDDITTWFRKRMLKAKTFQPVAVLNQKLKGLDVFETNEVPAIQQQQQQQQYPGQTIQPYASTTPQPDADFYVTRSHWQKSYGDDYCLDPSCQRPLGVVNGCVNCRKCGKLFCEEHTMYQIKLSRSAQHEPVRGYWSRVCETCYKSRVGYNDHNGIHQDHTSFFTEKRKAKVERQALEVHRAEKRLTRLTQLLTSPSPSPPPDQGNGFMKGIKPLLQNQRRALEQSVVAWEDDAKVTNCPCCTQTFSRFSLQKHHCRVCGAVVCGDLRTGCSKEIPFDVTAPVEKPTPSTAVVTINIRICAPCNTTIFSKRDFEASISIQPQYVRSYSTLVSFQTGILEQLPRFTKMVETIHKSKNRDKVVEAVKMKRRLIDTLAKIDGVAKVIATGATDNTAEHKLRRAVALATANWGTTVGMKVKTASTMLDAVVAATRPTAKQEIAARLGKPLPSPLAIDSGASSPVSSNGATTPKALMSPPIRDQTEREEDERREIVVVLEEQKFLVLQMLEEAKKRRRFDEVEVLAGSLDEIEAEIKALGGGVLGV